ncbi:autotransporter domain-containing protein [Phenylobacterium sp.]|uniref:autotransporter outer membrane beta-barrel domain-containing protein n=1 Tax=Phenylobacterium sp. TaxID=1871053 RepID=UPI00121D6DFF|nr:autotransporter outer membrane beta-barrel domain-containing protein [Phenylobacterium sp.]THD57822.1 MAG: autotransporter outer membrane beta-barrel domain-containing protein [Phenylobacterium sp.]
MLRFGPAMVSVSALIWAAPALAQTTTPPASTTLTDSTTKPQVTSQTGDLTINSGVTVHPPSGVAVTQDSNNSVTNNGEIQFQNKNEVTAILSVVPTSGLTGSISNNATIEVDDTTQPTTDKNGILHGPFASGPDRNGIIVTGTGTLTGDIDNSATGVITIKGDNSSAISIGTNLNGQIISAGSISASGTNVFGIHTTGSVSGPITLGGTISTAGQGAQAANFGGDIGGQLDINGTISSTGYRFTTRSTDPNFLKELAADDLLQGGAAVTVSGNVAGGVLVDASTSTDATTGVITSVEGTISQSAQAPAMVIGNTTAGHNIVLGNVGTDTDAYGLEIKGAVASSGVYDGVSSTGIQVGIAGGGTVNTSGGIHIVGSVTATSWLADSTAMALTGTIAPLIRNEGDIGASLNSDAVGITARAITIDATSVLTTLQNAANITATVAGPSANAIVIQDKSGTLAEIENIGIIATGRTFTASSAVTGQSVAMDLSANTSGVHIIQFLPSGDTLAPEIIGDITTGSGADRLEFLAGTVTGNINLGAGANSLSIDNGTVVKGNLDAPGGTLALSIGTGSLTINDASQLKLPTLSMGSAAALVVTADPVAGTATNLNVSGAANIASGATIGVRVASVLQGTETFNIVQAGQLNVGASASSLLGSSPFLYNTSLAVNSATGSINATLSTKTAAQLGLPSATAAGLAPLLANISKDAGLESALLSQTTQSGLVNLYNQMMPNHSASIFNTVAASVGAMSRPLDDRQDPVGGGFWMQETNAGVFQNGHDNDPGYKAWSFGAVAGYEVPKTPLGILGATFGASANQIYADDVDPSQDLHANLVDAGVYWRITKGGFSANVHLGADYVQVTSTRVIEVLGGDGLAVSRAADGHWNAWGVNAHAMASYEAHLGKAYIRPLVNVDYMRLEEGAYTETGGGDGMDLAVNSRTSSRLSAFAGVAVGALYGPDHSWGPEALIGYRSVTNEVLGNTTAKFVAGGDPFTLSSEDISGSGAAVHLSLRGENGSGGFAVETGAEQRDGLSIYDLRLTGHVQF